MPPKIKFVCLVAILALLAACSGGGVKKVVNPPRASIQQLTAQPNGDWQLIVRLQNFSNVSTRFEAVMAKLTIGGQDAGTVVLQPAITVGPESADIHTATFRPALGAKLAVASALSAGQPAAYSLAGKITTSEPKGSYDFTYDSSLNPAPGLPGVMR